MSINIEEERVVFEKAFCMVDISKQHNGEYSNSGVYWAFVGWCKAKVHAVEMAKPVLIVGETMGDKWGCCNPGDSRAYHICETREEIIQWAKANGYRVIEE